MDNSVSDLSEILNEFINDVFLGGESFAWGINDCPFEDDTVYQPQVVPAIIAGGHLPQPPPPMPQPPPPMPQPPPPMPQPQPPLPQPPLPMPQPARKSVEYNPLSGHSGSPATRSSPPILPQPSTSRAAGEKSAPIRRSGRIRKSKQPVYEPIPTASRGSGGCRGRGRSGGRGRTALLPKGPKLSLPAPTPMEVVAAEREQKAPVPKRKFSKEEIKERNKLAERDRRAEEAENFKKLLELFKVIKVKTALLPEDPELSLPAPTPMEVEPAQREKKARKPKMSAEERRERNKIDEKNRRAEIISGYEALKELYGVKGRLKKALYLERVINNFKNIIYISETLEKWVYERREPLKRLCVEAD